jgi:hypothetical protein
MSNFKNYLNVYSFESVLPGSGEQLTYKPITTGQMKTMLLYEDNEDLGRIEEALDSLISSCVLTEGFDIMKLFLQDRFFLLTEIRKATKGNMYTFKMECADCKGQSMQTIDLTKLKIIKPKFEIKKAQHPVSAAAEEAVKKVKKISVSKDNVPVVPWNILKLSDKITLELSIITRGIQAEAFKIVKEIKNMTMDQKKIEIFTIINALSIVAVITPDGREENIPLEDKIFLMNNITQSEMEKIVKWTEDNNFGLDFTFSIKCPHCNKETKREVPLDDFFF